MSALAGVRQVPLLAVESYPQYIWKSLDRNRKEIRLLHLLALESSGHVVASIEHVSLHDKPVYMALSYTWGSPDHASVLHLQDGSEVCITNNLADALRQLFANRLAPVGSVCVKLSPSTDNTGRVDYPSGSMPCVSTSPMVLRKAGRYST